MMFVLINIVAKDIVDKPQLPTEVHPNLTIVWANSSITDVTHQCLASIKMSSYEAYAWCDVIAMNITHILLRQPWHCDYNGKKDQEANTYTIPNPQGGQKVRIYSLTAKASSSSTAPSTENVHTDITKEAQVPITEKETMIVAKKTTMTCSVEDGKEKQDQIKKESSMKLDEAVSKIAKEDNDDQQMQKMNDKQRKERIQELNQAKEGQAMKSDESGADQATRVTRRARNSSRRFTSRSKH